MGAQNPVFVDDLGSEVTTKAVVQAAKAAGVDNCYGGKCYLKFRDEMPGYYSRPQIAKKLGEPYEGED